MEEEGEVILRREEGEFIAPVTAHPPQRQTIS
jgi:hypothetical protein